MQLISLTIENFRSIRSARKIAIGNATILIGPNNEGKSNILKALYSGMSALKHLSSGRETSRHRSSGALSRRYRDEYVGSYKWEVDYPIGQQNKNLEGKSTVILEFQLSDAEVDEFHIATGSTLNGTLPIQIKFGRSTYEATIAKPGRGGKALNQKKAKILQFISERMDIQYIPAVRTASHVEEIVERMVARALQPIEETPEYAQTLQKLEAMQAPILEKLSAQITEILRQFMPSLEKAQIANTQSRLYSAMRSSIEVIIDDGVPTSLKYKGDGVQSLVALGIMRYASADRSDARMGTIIALEEPESHLHPAAIRQLKAVLDALADKNQVVLTTHNPLFVNRVDIANNIIVNRNKAFPAKGIEQIRELLGVTVADNLRGADVILIVEGTEDEIALRGILSDYSKAIAEALRTGRLGIDPLAGAGNLTYKVGMHRANICKVHVFLDHDRAGKSAYEKCEKAGTLCLGDVNFARAIGHEESELEDLLDNSLTTQILVDSGIDIGKARNSKLSWSERIESACEVTGKPLTKPDLMKLKATVAHKAAVLGRKALAQRNVGPIEDLVRQLERILAIGRF